LRIFRRIAYKRITLITSRITGGINREAKMVSAKLACKAWAIKAITVLAIV